MCAGPVDRRAVVLEDPHGVERPELLVNLALAIPFFFLGMAYQRLNRAEQAKAKYQQGLRQMEKVFGGLDRYQPGKGDWFDWPLCQAVRREAEAVLKGDKAGLQQ